MFIHFTKSILFTIYNYIVDSRYSYLTANNTTNAAVEQLYTLVTLYRVRQKYENTFTSFQLSFWEILTHYLFRVTNSRFGDQHSYTRLIEMKGFVGFSHTVLSKPSVNINMVVMVSEKYNKQ